MIQTKIQSIGLILERISWLSKVEDSISSDRIFDEMIWT